MIASGLIFGWDLWVRWIPLILENLISPSEKWIEFGRMWGHSVYTCAVLLGAPLPLWCWTLAFMIWLLPMLSPPLIFPVARIAPLFPVLLIVLLLRPGISTSPRAQ